MRMHAPVTMAKLWARHTLYTFRDNWNISSANYLTNCSMLWRQIELSALCSNINRVLSPARYMHCTVLYQTANGFLPAATMDSSVTMDSCLCKYWHTHPPIGTQTDGHTHTLIYTYTFINSNKHEYSAIFSQGSGECARYMIATTINISESTTNAEQAIPMISNKKRHPHSAK